MKQTSKFFTFIAILLAGLSFTSCDDDVERATDLSGAWTGDMGMFVAVEYRNGRVVEYDAYRTDIEFTPHSEYATHGEGYQVDYYPRSCPYRYTCYYFQWSIDRGVIRLRYYDDACLNANITNYTLNGRIFDGWIGNTEFTLDKTYDYYHWDRYYNVDWSRYLYIGWDGTLYYDGGYWYDYYAPERRDLSASTDTTTNQTEPLPRIISHGSRFNK